MAESFMWMEKVASKSYTTYSRTLRNTKTASGFRHGLHGPCGLQTKPGAILCEASPHVYCTISAKLVLCVREPLVAVTLTV